MSDYDEYVKHQIEVGILESPERYQIGQKKAIDWFFDGIQKSSSILDVGCGIGTGMEYLQYLGYQNVVGIDLNPEKIRICKEYKLEAYQGDIVHFEFLESFDVVWCSHTFEHMFDPESAINKLRDMTVPNARLFFVLPYMDTGDPRAHRGSYIIGTRVADNGNTVKKWFEERSFSLLRMKFDAYRESEIWLDFEKI